MDLLAATIPDIDEQPHGDRPVHAVMALQKDPQQPLHPGFAMTRMAERLI